MKKDYHDFFNLIFNNFRPERITLGSLRGLTSTVNNVRSIDISTEELLVTALLFAWVMFVAMIMTKNSTNG